MYKVIKNIAELCLSGPLTTKFFKKINEGKTIFLGYHGVKESHEKLENWTMVTQEQFRQQMRFLKTNFDCISIDEAVSLNSKKKNTIVVTFDDGYENNFKIAYPILKEFNIPATIYITTKNVIERKLFWPDVIWYYIKKSNIEIIKLKHLNRNLGIYYFNGNKEELLNNLSRLQNDIKKIVPDEREAGLQNIIEEINKNNYKTIEPPNVEGEAISPMTSIQLKKLSTAPLITIGAHTHCHNLLDQIDIKKAENTIKKSKEILEDICKKEIKHFAFPNGNYNDDIIRLVKKTGFKTALTFDPGYFEAGGDTFKIKRFGIGAELNILSFKVLLSGVFYHIKKNTKLNIVTDYGKAN